MQLVIVILELSIFTTYCCIICSFNYKLLMLN